MNCLKQFSRKLF